MRRPRSGIGPSVNQPERSERLVSSILSIGSTLTDEPIELGDDVWFGQDVFVCDGSQGYQDPDLPIPARTHRIGLMGRPCAIILPGTTIGRNSVVAAGFVVRGDVADHCVVGGPPPSCCAGSSRGSAGSAAAAMCGRCDAGISAAATSRDSSRRNHLRGERPSGSRRSLTSGTVFLYDMGCLWNECLIWSLHKVMS